MDNYKPNSNKYKNQQREKKKIEKVIDGKVRVKKKSEISKLASIFLPEDVDDIWKYILLDILVPSAKKIASEMFNAFLYGRGSSNGKRYTSNSISYVDYSSKPTHTSSSDRFGSIYDFDDIIFKTKGEAEEVLFRLCELIEVYDVASIGDFYDLVGVTSLNYAIENYGWKNLQTARTVRVSDGWMIKLPKALPINK